MDPLTEADALQEAQLLDVRFDALTSTAGILFEMRTALQPREANTGVLVAHGVRELSWAGPDRSGELGKTVGSVRIRLKAPSESVNVYFEPTGMDYVLMPGDWFDVTISGEGSGLADIIYKPGAIVVAAWAGSDTTVISRDGTILDV